MSWAAGVAIGFVVFLVMAILRSLYLSFRGQRPTDYSNDHSKFDLKTHLNGPMRCEGVIYGPLGRVVSRFVARFDIEWFGDQGVMRERFEYDSGEVQDRAWKLSLGDNGTFQATADDVVGTGIGHLSGGTVQLLYKIRLPKDAGGHVLNVTDWMYLTNNGTIMNRSQFRKFGFKVAELIATFRKEDAA